MILKKMKTKVCKVCGRELPLIEFYKAKGCKDGHKNECKECAIQRQKQYHRENRDKILERQKQYRQDNRESIAEYQKQYNKQYYQDNREAFVERKKQHYQENRESIAEQQRQYRQTPNGRAHHLVNKYKQSDKESNRGECTLTAQWVVDNIFTQPCHWCGETDWKKLGCDRIDNSLPHTPDNVLPCCDECNKKRGRKTYEEFMNAIRTDVVIL